MCNSYHHFKPDYEAVFHQTPRQQISEALWQKTKWSPLTSKLLSKFIKRATSHPRLPYTFKTWYVDITVTLLQEGDQNRAVFFVFSVQKMLQVDRGIFAPSTRVQNVYRLHVRVSTYWRTQPVRTTRALQSQVGDWVGCLPKKGVGSSPGREPPRVDTGTG